MSRVKIKVLEKKTNGVSGEVRYCVLKMHIRSVLLLGQVISRDVTDCDGSCERLENPETTECEAEDAEQFRPFVGRGTIHTAVHPVG